VIEHAAIPDAAERQRQPRQQSGPRPGDHPGGREGRRHPADAGERAHHVTNVIGVERQQMREQDRDDVEQAAVEIEVLKIEDRLVRKAALVIGDDQFAVVVLQAFIVGNGVFLERGEDQRDEHRHQQDGRQIEYVDLESRKAKMPAGRGGHALDLLSRILSSSVDRPILDCRPSSCHGRTCSGHLDEDCTMPSSSRSPGHKGVYARR
jgi:hypothetical protein